jgi:crossover junction endodeoxyribonuclease RuvC
MIILGIDPGTKRIGYGLIKSENQKIKFLASGILKIKEKEPKNFLEIEKELFKIIKKYKPTLAVIEKIYFMKNQKTAIEVAQARGIIMNQILKNKIKLIECTPNEMKAAITGYGFADKKAIFKMVRLILNLPESTKMIDDAADALAMAIFGNFIQKAVDK